MTDDDLVDALARNVVGKPASLCDWRDLLHVRDVIDDLLNGEVNRRQDHHPNTASTSPNAVKVGTADPSETKAGERLTSFAAETRPAPTPSTLARAGRAGVDGHHRHRTTHPTGGNPSC